MTDVPLAFLDTLIWVCLHCHEPIARLHWDATRQTWVGTCRNYDCDYVSHTVPVTGR